MIHVRNQQANIEPVFFAYPDHAEIDAIVGNPRKPTFGNTIVALERQGELLARIEGVFYEPALGRHVGRDAGNSPARAAKLTELSEYLLERETITGEEFMEILNR